MSQIAPVKLLQSVLALDEIEAHRKGYAWYVSHLLPCLQYSQWPADQHPLVADIWYMANTIHQVNGAPLAAIAAAKKALSFDSEHLESIYDLIDLHLEIGHYQEAFDLVNQAIDLEPDDVELLFTKQNIQDALNYNETPLYSEDDPIWPFHEQLAQGRFSDFLATAKMPEDLPEEWLRCRAAAFAATEQWTHYLDGWQELAQLESPVEFTALDWFYLPDSFLGNEAFWKSIGQAVVVEKPDYTDD
ncbi:MAG: tetratricopeptide repeat protein [Bacteroidota bacterium]